MSAPTYEPSALKNRKKDSGRQPGSATNKNFSTVASPFGVRTVAGFRCIGSLRFWRQSPSRRAHFVPRRNAGILSSGQVTGPRAAELYQADALAAARRHRRRDQGTMRSGPGRPRSNGGQFFRRFFAGFKPINHVVSFRAAESCFKAFMNSPACA